MGTSERTRSYVSSNRGTTPPTWLERWLIQKLVEFVGRPPVTIELWNGERLNECTSELAVSINSRTALYGLLRNTSIGFGESYTDGSITVSGDLVGLMERFYQGQRSERFKSPLNRALRTLLARRPTPNSLETSRDNIYTHYDLGNEFYGLWLDREYMQYTCAYYPTPEATLEEAQIAKLEHVCRKLNLQPGERVVEAGCGWGGLARYMARHYGVQVRSYNISKAQVSYARMVAEQEGLGDAVEYVEDDYRNISGTYDVFVSVGMLEHVGVQHYQALGEVVDRALEENGRGLIHSIGRNRPRQMDNWVEKHIFPGAYPPTIGEMMRIFEPNGFSIMDIENLRTHYARTLTDWCERYEQCTDQVRDMFDERFVRTWRLYLAGSHVAFTEGELQLFQVLFQRPHANVLPITRHHLYVDSA